MNVHIDRTTARHASWTLIAALCIAALIVPLYRVAQGEEVALPVIFFCAGLVTAVLARVISHETSQFVLVITSVHLFMLWMVSMM